MRQQKPRLQYEKNDFLFSCGIVTSGRISLLDGLVLSQKYMGNAL